MTKSLANILKSYLRFFLFLKTILYARPLASSRPGNLKLPAFQLSLLLCHKIVSPTRTKKRRGTSPEGSSNLERNDLPLMIMGDTLAG
jgi:hypothetical protein